MSVFKSSILRWGCQIWILYGNVFIFVNYSVGHMEVSHTHRHQCYIGALMGSSFLRVNTLGYLWILGSHSPQHTAPFYPPVSIGIHPRQQRNLEFLFDLCFSPKSIPRWLKEKRCWMNSEEVIPMHFSSSSVNESQQKGGGFPPRINKSMEWEETRWALDTQVHGPIPARLLWVSLGLISSQAKLNKLD